MESSTQGIVIPSTYASTQAPEKFSIPSRGQCEWHTHFSQPSTPTDSMCSGIAVCPPRTVALSSHRHEQAEIYYIISGSGYVTINDKKHWVESGSSVFIPGNAEHSVTNEGEEVLRFFYVFPTGAFSNVIYRFSDEVDKDETANTKVPQITGSEPTHENQKYKQGLQEHQNI